MITEEEICHKNNNFFYLSHPTSEVIVSTLQDVVVDGQAEAAGEGEEDHSAPGGGHGDCRDRRQTLTGPSPSLLQRLYLGSPYTLSQYMLTPIISYVFSTYYYTIFFSGIFLKSKNIYEFLINSIVY